MVECHLAKVDVASPNLVYRSISRRHSQVVRQSSAKASFSSSSLDGASTWELRCGCIWVFSYSWRIRASCRPRSAGVTGKLPEGALGRAQFLLSGGVRARGMRMPDKAVIRFSDQYEREAQSEEGVWGLKPDAASGIGAERAQLAMKRGGRSGTARAVPGAFAGTR